MKWLMSLLHEVMDATFEWISIKSEVWTLTENLVDNRTKFMQVSVCAHFLIIIDHIYPSSKRIK